MTNAKEELLDIVNKNGLTIEKIDIKMESYDYYNRISLFINSLDELDFEYYNGYGGQELFGVVYCRDDKNEPVWLTRGEYDGSEWWEINRIPEYYRK